MTDFPLTFKCNNNCISCIIRYDIVEKLSEPSLKQIENVIDKIDPHTDYFGVGGGEPTLRKEFFDILQYARQTHPDLFIFLTTNGRMFAYKTFAKRLADLEHRNFRVAVPIYGLEEVHETITRSKGSFKQAVKGVKNLIFFGIPTEIRIIINKINYQHLEDTTRFITREFPGVERVVFVNMKITGNAFKNIDKVLVRYRELVPYVEKAVGILKKNNINTYLYHFPLCIIPEALWNIAKGITKEEKFELTFVEECERCKMKSECPMIWKTYVFSAGKNEFKPIVK